MKFDATELRRQYAGLSDEALLEINRDELVEAARHVYDAEIEERGLASKPAAEVEAPPAAPPDSLPGDVAQVAVYYSVDEARIARNLLQAAEIPCDVANEPDWQVNGIRLLVPANLLEDAKLVLSTELTEEDLAAQAFAAGDPDQEVEDQVPEIEP
jgi:hypothetical protein